MLTINDLREGALYELPNGDRVRTARMAGGMMWFLTAFEVKRSYALDPAGAVRLILYVDAAGVRRRVFGNDGYGNVTDFIVGDLRSVES